MRSSRVAATPSPTSTVGTDRSGTDLTIAQLPSLSGVMRLLEVRAVPEGLLLMLSGTPQATLQRIVNPDRVVVDLQGTSVPREMHGKTIPINQLGVRQVRVAQFQTAPAIARVVLDFDPNHPNSQRAWQGAFATGRGGLLLVPAGGVTAGGNNGTFRPVEAAPPAAPQPSVAINPGNSTAANLVQSIALTAAGQLLIQATQPVSYRGTEDPTSGGYNILLSNVRISPQLQRPALAANGALERIRLTQVGDSVLVGVRPSPGWRVREIGQVSPQQIALQVYGASAPPQPTVVQVPPLTTIPAPVRTPTPSPVPSAPTNRGRGVVVIDPGHGGPDVGAIGNGLYEKNLVLPLSLQLGRVLQQMGYSVAYTRTSDIDLDLQPRVDIAERYKADVFVSIHANSLASRANSVSGIETYYAPGAELGRQLADAIHREVIAATGAVDRGVRSARFHVIRNTTMPSVLLETGFVTNPTEAARLNDPNYQARMAAAIARGVDAFLRGRR